MIFIFVDKIMKNIIIVYEDDNIIIYILTININFNNIH